MTAITCAAARRRLDAYHDQELPISDQIVVGAHLEHCDRCADRFADLQRLRTALRTSLPGRSASSRESQADFYAEVVERIRAAQAAALRTQIRELFRDMHLVYAGVGAVVAALVCLTVTVTMFRFAMMIARPDSLPAIVHLVESPEPKLTDLPSVDLASPVPISARVLMPSLNDPVPINLRGDGMLTLAALVSREGQMSNIEVVHAMAGQGDRDAADAAIGSVMGAMSRARFEPARVDGLPVAVNMVWLVAHTTVRPQTATARSGKRRIAAVEATAVGNA